MGRRAGEGRGREGAAGRLPFRGPAAGLGSPLCGQSHELGFGQGHLGPSPCPACASVP